MYKKIKARQLTEGDWIADDIILKKLKLTSVQNKGITLQQIKLLKNYNKLITIKLGIPFIPGFWLAYVFLLIIQQFNIVL